MSEHSVELVIRLTAPKPWNPRTVGLVERVLKDKADEVISTAQAFARGWSEHGEPTRAEVEFRVRETSTPVESSRVLTD